MGKTELDKIYQERIEEILSGIEASMQTSDRIQKALDDAMRESLRPMVKEAVAAIMKGMK